MMATPEKQERWASLADRLNPNRTAFDPTFKEEWKNMSKAQRKRFIKKDKCAIQELKTRGTAKILPFEADPNDHCETSPIAYSHVVPFLRLIAQQLNKSPEELEIYDPYYCSGAIVRHLKELGFDRVHNKPHDFYADISNNRIPNHDVIVTNPPYSGDHFERLLNFLRKNRKPFLMLLPKYFGKHPAYTAAQTDWLQPIFVTPPERYHYWTPEGLRPEEDAKKCKHRNLYLGNRNSPFSSFWFVSLQPLLSKKYILQENEIKLPKGCKIHANLKDADAIASVFRCNKKVATGESCIKNKREEDSTQFHRSKRKKRRI